jgi:tRNA-dihydrouridine synthase B
MNTLETSEAQLEAVNRFFDAQLELSDRLVYVDENDDNKEGELLAA